MHTALDPTIRPGGGYLDVDGVATYHEVTGDGDPVVLLHGGLCTAETLDAQVAALAPHHRVHVPERYGHGRTRDVDGPLTYEGMARHLVRYLDALGVTSAHLAGWSDGALVALLVALRRPGLVRTLVLIDQFLTADGARPGYWTIMDGLTEDALPPEMVAAARALSPDGPGRFPVVLAKLHALWTGETGVEIADLVHVTVPTLLLAADGGGSTLAHLADVHRALPDSQLAVVPGTSHGLPLEKPELVNRLILDFLADEQAPMLFPRLTDD